MTHFCRQPRCSYVSVIDQQVHEQSDHCGRDEGFAWSQQHGFPLSKADLATAATVEYQIYQQQRPTPFEWNLLHGTIPWGN